MKPKILISTGGGNAGSYLNALRAAGGDGEARYLPDPDPSYDGLLLAGGEDMDPALFGRENRGSRGIDRARDEAELALLDAFCGAEKPVFAICRGHQVVNVWLGGGLVQDLGPAVVPFHQRETGDRVHAIQAEKGSLLRRLYGPVFPVNSSHHQGLGRLGRGLRASAWWSDGTAEVIEAAEHESLPLLCVQFHPERMTGALARPGPLRGADRKTAGRCSGCFWSCASSGISTLSTRVLIVYTQFMNFGRGGVYYKPERQTGRGQPPQVQRS